MVVVLETHASRSPAAGNAGDHARRSIIRRVYLYLALFVSVVGGMIVAVTLLNILLRALFGNPEENLLQQVLKTWNYCSCSLVWASTMAG